MRTLLNASMLAAAATVSAQTYAPLIPAIPEGPPPNSVVVNDYTAANFFGGDITATFTVTYGGQSGAMTINNEFNFTYIDGAALFPNAASGAPPVDGGPTPMIGGVTTMTFSESITQLVLGWAGPTGTPGFTYTVFDGATQVHTAFVATSATDPETNNSAALLDYSRLGGFTSVVFYANDAQYALGYGTGPAVPEPSTYGLMVGGLALAVVAMRRRKISK